MLSLTRIKKECNIAFRIAGYNFDDFNIKVSINSRLKSTLGRCRYRKNTLTGEVTPTEIQISQLFLSSTVDNDVIDIIRHECAHALCCIETGDRQGHNNYFKNMCNRIHCNHYHATADDIKRTIDDKELYKYFIKCPHCDKIISKYHRAGKVIKNIDYYYCKDCGKYDLIVIQNF